MAVPRARQKGDIHAGTGGIECGSVIATAPRRVAFQNAKPAAGTESTEISLYLEERRQKKVVGKTDGASRTKGRWRQASRALIFADILWCPVMSC